MDISCVLLYRVIFFNIYVLQQIIQRMPKDEKERPRRERQKRLKNEMKYITTQEEKWQQQLFFLFFSFLLHSVVFHFLSNAIYINGKILLRLCDLTEDNHDDEKHTAASERDSSISQLVDGLALDERTRVRRKMAKIVENPNLGAAASTQKLPHFTIIILPHAFSSFVCVISFSIIMWCNSS